MPSSQFKLRVLEESHYSLLIGHTYFSKHNIIPQNHFIRKGWIKTFRNM
jgi:hypothetical protein